MLMMETKRQKEHKLLVERQQHAKLVKRGKIKPATWENAAKMLAEAFGEVTRNISRTFDEIRVGVQRYRK